jgi:hypothetical protein
MAALRPSLELVKQDEATILERSCRRHGAMVVRPAMSHQIDLLDELSL